MLAKQSCQKRQARVLERCRRGLLLSRDVTYNSARCSALLYRRRFEMQCNSVQLPVANRMRP
jgi:hypothetical protein